MESSSRQTAMNGHSRTTYNHVIQNGVTSPSTPSAAIPSPTKSFVQQRIERLYGPGALGIAFQAKRAMLERYHRDHDNNDIDENAVGIGISPPGLPSVFKHLRPEFRHQLPVKTQNSNGHAREPVVRHIPIEIEPDIIVPPPTPPPSVTQAPSFSTANKSIDNATTSVRNLRIDVSDDKNAKSELSSTKDGHHFLKVIASEVSLLAPIISRAERDLELSGEDMNEEVKGKLLSAVGKGKLLVSQKIEQFKGLCQKNISKSCTEEFPTTNDDLAGFWDMVAIQVEDVHKLLAEIDALRKNAWKELSVKPSINTPPKVEGRKVVRKSKCTPPSNKEAIAKQQAAALAAAERRRQMREVMNAKRLQAKTQEADVEIFVAEK